MPEKSDLAYAALITLSFPGQTEPLRITVKLLPADTVPAAGGSKPLRDCTLADLLAYANVLEKEVWETFEAITLPALDDDEQIDVTITATDGAGEPLEAWDRQLLWLPDEKAPADAGVDGDEGAPVSESVEPVPYVADLTTPAAATDVADEPAEEKAGLGPGAASEEPVEEPLEGVSVAESEPVFPDEPEKATETATTAPPVTGVEFAVPPVVPSRARVRVAGGRLPIGHPTWAAVDILIDEPALRATQAHALSSLEREVAGVLLGPRPEKQPDGRYLVHVIDTIVARHTVMQGASVTYTPESWRYLNDTLGERYPDETAVMVGWYHTHPGFGIFLSGMDLFIHQNFFTQIWHIAYVLDPRARTSGFFCWDRHKSRVSRSDFFWPPWAAGGW